MSAEIPYCCASFIKSVVLKICRTWIGPLGLVDKSIHRVGNGTKKALSVGAFWWTQIIVATLVNFGHSRKFVVVGFTSFTHFTYSLASPNNEVSPLFVAPSPMAALYQQSAEQYFRR